MTIAILSVFSPPVLSFLKSCKEKNIKTVYLCICAGKDSLPDSKFFQEVHRIPSSRVFRKEGIQLIASILKNHNDPSLYTINEKMAKWLAVNEHALGNNISLMLQKPESIENVLSKKKQADSAIASELNLLKTYYITGEKKQLDLINDRDYPLCVRPSSPGSVKPSFKVKVFYKRNALERFVRKRTYSEKGIIAQPFLNLPNLVVHGSRTINGQSIGLQGFLVDRKFEGLTLTIKPVNLPDSFLKKCIRFTEIMEITGPYHFEFLYDKEKDEIWFLEINARMGGTTAKVYALGYDEPGFLLKSYGHHVKIKKKLKNTISVSKMALFKYFVYTFTNKITPLDYPDNETKWERITITIKALMFYTDDIFSLKDYKSTISIYWNSIKGKLR